MQTDRQNFEAWFVQPLESLYPKVEQFGFIIVMVTLPLLERYLRQKENITGDTLKQEFYIALERLFPELQGQRDETRKFWRLCRNGLLHRSTFNGPGIYLVRNLNTPVVVARGDQSDFVFHLDPVAFSKKVLATIGDDFEVYANSLTSPLPVISPLRTDATVRQPPYQWGTGLPSQPQTTPFPESLRDITLP
jgi:hypothetical protein